MIDTIASVLLEKQALLSLDIRASMTQEAAVVFLALLHLLRESRMLALLSHYEPTSAFEIGAVEDVLNESGKEDFRWPFLFFDKVLPFSFNGVSWTDMMLPALSELAERDLVEEVPMSDGKVWDLTPTGYRVFLATHHHLTKVGLRVTVINDEGERGHEGLLFIRSFQDLFLFDMAGKEAVIATLDMKGMRRLLKGYFEVEETQKPEKSCVACAARIPSDAELCSVCGVSVITNVRASASLKKERAIRPPNNGGDSKKRGGPPPLKKNSPPRCKKKRVSSGPPPLKTSRRFCSHCGNKMNSGVKYCTKCGKKA